VLKTFVSHHYPTACTKVYLLNFGTCRYLSNTIINEFCSCYMTKILLIDDDPDVRMVMSRALSKQGYEVDTASRREEALAKLAVALPSLILLDVLLSGTDGRELCREIKADKKTQAIPVIMLSGHPGAAASRFENYGADDFIAKPVNIEALLEKMSNQMSDIK